MQATRNIAAAAMIIAVFLFLGASSLLTSEGFFGAVISRKRLQTMIRNVFSSSAYQLHPHGVLAYGALQDYRAIDNEVGPALILSEYSPEIQ